jgi:C_GCAxxG_C_C family probable redox protein
MGERKKEGDMDAADVAAARFGEGYSCAQSVFSALAQQWCVELEVSLRVAAGFGGGIARSARTCGCVTGAIMALGLAQEGIGPEVNRAEKEKTHAVCQKFMQRFERRHGSTLCAKLLGFDISTPEGLAKARQLGLFEARCAVFVRDAVRMAQDALVGL